MAELESPSMPQPQVRLARPERVYMTVSRSGEMWRPQRVKSSAVLTTTERLPGERAIWRPCASFAPPTPPARASTECDCGDWGEGAELDSVGICALYGQVDG